LQFEMKDGTLPHVSLAEDAEPIKVTRFVGRAELHEGAIEVKDAELDSPDGKFQVSGTSSLKGELDFKLARTPNGAAAGGYAITGTVAEPQVVRTASPDTQAQLKSEPAK
jgi:hypothetical protein